MPSDNRQQGPALRRATPRDSAAVERLLTGLGLPAAGMEEWIEHFWVADAAGAVVAAAGLELYADGALLRSVAVSPERRGTGVGRALVERALHDATERNLGSVYLLTTTAAAYFPRLGFETIVRDEVPEGVRRSTQFQGACPASAVVMRKRLAGTPTTPPR